MDIVIIMFLFSLSYMNCPLDRVENLETNSLMVLEMGTVNISTNPIGP